MNCRYARAALPVAVLLVWAAPSYSVERGQPLAAALEELRRAGLQLVFSSSLVDPSFSVSIDPGTGSPEEIARRILAPHGLTLAPLRLGLFAVVPQDESDALAAAAPARSGDSETRISEPLLEVDVYASRYQIETHNPAAVAELTREDMDSMPGLNQDALRVTRYLPGTASNALSARTYVRGGRDDELAVYFDGIPLFEPFHYKDVQSILGIVDPGAVSRIDFFSGVFPVRYGNRLSGVLDITPRVWMGQNHHELGASLLYSHVLSQGRLSSYPIEWLAAARHSNMDLVTDTLERDDIEPQFLDAFARIQLTGSEASDFGLGWFLLDDGLEANFAQGEERADIGYRDAIGWAYWDFHPRKDVKARTTVSLTERHTDRAGSVLQNTVPQGVVDDRRRFDTVSARFDGTLRLNEMWYLGGGLEWYGYNARYNYRSSIQFDPVFASAFGRPQSISRDTQLSLNGDAYAGYISALTSLTSRIDIDVGLRWDRQRYGRAFDDDEFSPRLSVQYQHDPTTVLRVSWGRLAQAVRPDELQVQDGESTFHATQRATQFVASVEKRVREGALLRVEAFNKRISEPRPIYENLLDPFALLPELEVDRVRVAPDRSLSYGAELSLRWDARKVWSGWMSYSWSEVTDELGETTTPRTWNQRHSASVGGSWTRQPWLLSANTAWHSGWRRNHLQVAAQSTSSAPVLELSPRNTDSWPNYLSLDVRAAWQRTLPRGALELYLEVHNVTNHANLCCVSYEWVDSGSAQTLSADTSVSMSRLALVGITWQLP